MQIDADAKNINITIISGGSVLIKVEDDGCGVKQEDLELLFQVGYSTKFCPVSGKMSTGLGLAHVKNLTESLGGTVSVVSSQGQSTRFTVALPLENLVGPNS